jgi:hypothetical protein
VVRALGASLGAAGVQQALSDPALQVRDKDGNLITSNDNWKVNDPSGQSQEVDIRATGAPPNNELESALVGTFAPGNYTVILSGKSGATGVSLVEVYNLR